MILVFKRWFYSASCMGPIIIVREADYNITLLNHEYIHVKQQKECLYLFAHVIYIAEFLVKLLYYRNVKTAYLAVSFEREAYLFQHVVGYANNRKHFVWLRFIYVRKKAYTSNISEKKTNWSKL